MSIDEKNWSELSNGERSLMVIGSAVQLGLQAVALIDLYRRDQSEIRGKKSWWVALSFVNFLGPIAYLIGGRR